MKSDLGIILTYVSLAVALAISAGLLPHAAALAAGLCIVAILLVKRKIVLLLVSISAFGLPFIGSLAFAAGTKPTILIAAMDTLIVPYALYGLFFGRNKYESKGLLLFLAWWVSFFLVYSFADYLGPGSDYAVFGWQYLLIYGNFYVHTGVLAANHRIRMSDVVVLGALWFSYMYPILHSTFFGVAGIADSEIGLRAIEGMDPIGTARWAGMLILAALGLIMFSPKKLLKIPITLVSCLIGLPLAWFSYTRQVYVGIALILLCMVLYLLFKRHYQIRTRDKYIGLLAVFVGGVLAVYKLYTFIVHQASHSRISESGLKLDRTGLWSKTFEMIMSAPITGIGVGGFQASGVGMWPHNWFLEAWLELSILGLALAIIGAWKICVALLSKKIDLTVLLWTFMGIYTLIVAQVSADIPRNSQLYFFIAIGFYASYLRNPMLDKTRARRLNIDI